MPCFFRRNRNIFNSYWHSLHTACQMNVPFSLESKVFPQQHVITGQTANGLYCLFCGCVFIVWRWHACTEMITQTYCVNFKIKVRLKKRSHWNKAGLTQAFMEFRPNCDPNIPDSLKQTRWSGGREPMFTFRQPVCYSAARILLGWKCKVLCYCFQSVFPQFSSDL